MSLPQPPLRDFLGIESITQMDYETKITCATPLQLHKRQNREISQT